MSQDTLSFHLGTGILTIKNNAGPHFYIGATYIASKHVSIYTDIGFSSIQLTSVGNSSNLNRYEIGAQYGLLNGSTKISSIMGFSIISHSDRILFDKDISPSLELGILMLSNADKAVSFGIKWINSFSIPSIGSMMYVGAQFQVKL